MGSGLLDLRDTRGLPLRQLRPPGALYRTWFFLPAGMNPDSPESWGLFGLDGTARRAAVLALHELAPFYGGEIPEAALRLQEYVRALHIPVRRRDGRAAPTPLKNFVTSIESMTASKTEQAPSPEAVHRLHAEGVFVLGDDLAARIRSRAPGRHRTPGLSASARSRLPAGAPSRTRGDPAGSGGWPGAM